MSKKSLIFFIFLTANSLFGQNLISNSGFEMDSCQYEGFLPYTDLLGKIEVTDWILKGTVDHLHTDCELYNLANGTWPFEGHGAIILGSTYIPNSFTSPLEFASRDYALIKLNQPLKKDFQYDINFWVKPVNKKSQSIETSLGFLRDLKQLENLTDHNYLDYIFNIPTKISYTKEILSYTEFSKVSSCYKAEGWEEYLIIGNFEPNESLSFDTIYVFDQPQLFHDSETIYDNISVELVPELGSDTIICTSEIIEYPSKGYDNLFINNNEMHSDYLIDDDGIYEVEAVKGSCHQSKTIQINTYDCKPCDIYIPNIICPRYNYDNKTLIGSNCNILSINSQVYTRWGTRIYNSNDAFNWNGYVNGDIVPGVYVYNIDVRLLRNSKTFTERYTGEITVIK